ncbi:MAG: hypothetical protein NC225_06360 [Clostridium sp.]|nr:hypothetical protein [Clostridium sp.]MCM1399091.1 hypothetical protein [Clostridium sp.]MCM1459483.1 hypothetical protein [Bacteroides sp.]
MKKYFYQKALKKQHMILFVLLICMAGLLCACGHQPKNFTELNLTITLTDAFHVEKNNSFDIYIESDDVVFSAVQETTHELEYAGYEIQSLRDYCDEIISLNSASKDSLKTRNNYYYFTNTRTVDKAKYTYVHCMFQQGDSFWICEFACKSKNFNRLEEKILSWADSITFQ